MSLPPAYPATIGAWPKRHARLVQAGTLALDAGGIPRSVTDTWAVYLDPYERPDPATIVGLPAKNDRHPQYPYLIRGGLEFRSAAERSGSVVWFVSVAYAPSGASTSYSGGSGSGSAATIACRILAREWPIYASQVDLATAVDGTPVLTPAGQPYDRVPTITRRLVGARVVRAESGWPAVAIGLDNTINSAAVTVLGIAFAKHRARLEVTVEDTLAVGSDDRYRVTYDVIPASCPYSVDGDPAEAGWDLPLLACGYAYLDGDGNLVRATDPSDDGGEPTPSAQPVLLAADGTRLADGDDPVYDVVQAYAEASWAALSLPANPTDGDPPAPTNA